ncbi:GAF domain-containing protein [Candidatus Bathyarchaeota archaeon]|nr:GAF domain-containing protein [Candidatus Bathyarchaeota archaeon]
MVSICEETCKNFAEAARQIFEAAKTLTGATSGYVALLSEDGYRNEVLFLDSGGLPCSVDPDLPMPIRGLRGEAYKKGCVIYDNNFSKSKWMQYMPSGHVTLESVLFAPIIIDQEVEGLIGLANKDGGFGEEDKSIMAAFANAASIALMNSKLLDTTKEQKDFIEHAINALHDIFFVFEFNTGQTLWWNRAFKDITGFDDDTIRSMHAPDDFLTQESIEHLAQTEEAFRKHGKITIDIDLITETGDAIPIECNASLKEDLRGENLNVFFIGRDLRELREKEKSLKESENRYRRAYQRANFFKDLLMHDINNILQGILSSAEFIEILATKHQITSKMEHSLDSIKSQVLRASKLIDNIRKLMLLNQDERELGKMNLENVINRSIRLLEHNHPDREMVITKDLPDHPIVRGDELIIDVFDNILNNAVIHNNNEMVVIDITGKEIITQEGNIMFRIHISDNGVGIRDGQKEAIFNRSDSFEKNRKGMGFGLSLVSKIMDLYGGAIKVKNKIAGDYTKGTTFILDFPGSDA